jgi:L-fuculose-phosphate aldolase
MHRAGAQSMNDVQELKEQICEIGRRIYERGFVAANAGNITCRLTKDEVLCTPTMISKGFMQPADLCLIDMTGKQLAGTKKRSSEALMHLEILRARPDVSCVVHCHPPHATAFAIVGESIPQAVMPEVEVFLGEVPITKYETPGTKRFAETVLPFVHKTNIILLANHGAVSYGDSPERAFWLTEILDSYCRVLILTRQLGPLRYLPAEKVEELLKEKQKMGFADPRHDADFCGDLRANATFGQMCAEYGVAPRAFPPPTD